MTRFALVVLALCFAVSAQAGDMRFPQTGYPAVSFHMPDDWTGNPDDAGNIILASGDHSTVFALSVVTFAGTDDELATGAMKAAGASAPTRGEAATLSGYSGAVYRSDMKNDSGMHVNIKMIAVKMDAEHAVTCSLLYADTTTDDQLAVAKSVQDSMVLLPAPSR